MEQSYYPQILKIISSVNLRSFKEENVVCDNHTFFVNCTWHNINAVARGLNLPRETSRRKVEELINLNWVIINITLNFMFLKNGEHKLFKLISIHLIEKVKKIIKS